METLGRALPPPTRAMLLIAASLSYADGAAWRAQGWATVKALDGEDDLRVGGAAPGMQSRLDHGAPVAVEQSAVIYGSENEQCRGGRRPMGRRGQGQNRRLAGGARVVVKAVTTPVIPWWLATRRIN